MLKKIDWYTIKTFFGPFFFIFSILFFIFIVQFAWAEMDNFLGKGLDWFTIAKLLFYFGINVIQLVLPLTILLASIMTMGDYAERYELAAMKAAGISLRRILTPLFIVICIITVGLYFFGDRVMPYSQNKAKNLLFNILQAKPTVNLTAGVFIETVPGFSMKIERISGKNQEKLDNVFVHKNANYGDDQQTIIAKNGILAVDKEDKHYLKMELFNGYIYSDDIKGKNYKTRKKQPNRIIKFDTLNQYIDISEMISSNNDQENNIRNHYKFLKGYQLKNLIDSLYNSNVEFNESIKDNAYKANIYESDRIGETLEELTADDSLPVHINELEPDIQLRLYNNAINQISQEKNRYNYQGDELVGKNKLLSRVTMYYQRNYAYAFTCVVFFLIGAPLGAIVKKGGIGMPVIISIVIFILYYIINFSSENMAKNGNMNPTFAAWSANVYFFPFAIILFYKANHDSALFNVDNYIDPIRKFFNKYKKQKTSAEHSRYQ